MSARTMLGWSLLSLPFAAMFAFGWAAFGFAAVAAAFLAAAVVYLIIWVGVWLVVE